MASFEVLGEQKKTLSNLPLLRFTSIVTVLVALDSLACISLWIAGGDSQYLENNVKQFSITRSTFDLACLAAVRGVVIIASYYYLEQFIILKSSTRSSQKQVQSTRFSMFCQTIIILFSMASFIYSIVKGSLLIRRIIKQELIEMHITYKILCIASVAFSLIELLIGIISSYCIRKMVHERGLRLLINQDQGDEKPAKKRVDLRRLIWLAKPEYPLLLAALLCLMVSAGSLSIAPFLFGKVINYAVPGQSNCTDKYGRDIPPNVTNCVPYTMERMNRMVVYLILVFVVGSIGVMARQILFNLAGERFVARLRKKLFSSIIQQEVGFYDQNRIGELTNRLSADTQVIQSAVTENMSMLTRFSMQALISIGLMFYVSAKLTAVLLSVVPVIVVSAVQYGRFLKGLKKNYQDELAKASSTAEESFGNILTVRSFSNEKRTIVSYSKDINASYKLGRKLSFLVGIFMGVVTLLLYAAAALVLWYGGYLVYHEDIQTGTLISLMLYTLNLAMCFALLSNVYGEFMQAVGASTRIFDLLDRVSEIRDGKQVLDHLKGEIIFDKVVFSYPSRPDEEVLKGVSFEMLPGQVVAVVGQSGGGKSTIVKLIEHFYEVSSGRILLSGCNVRQLDPEWFRKHIGLVSQEPVLFANTIAKNIAYGRENATNDEIREAAIQANAHNFIMSFEEGYETMVGERGVRLSGGQKQRVAIARALLLNPEILLLDEATSALDAESEHLVQEAIDRAMKGRTVLVIAHRLSTVKNANMVMVMDRGRIVEYGTHDELIALNGVYKQLVIRQLEQ